MNSILRSIVLVGALVLLTQVPSYHAQADHDDHEKRHRYENTFDRDDDDDDDHHSGRKDLKHHNERYLNPVENGAYTEACGACHFPYQPALLPSGSWKKILAGVEDHFGEVLDIDTESKKVIA